jgi:ABC-type nitrate/sulfonate/bicarbonate transport system substrate-binding protein
VQPEIKSYEDLRGKTVAVDAPNTAYALVLYKMLDLKGIKKSEYEVKPVGGTHQRVEALLKDKTISATMLNPPFSVRAEREGLKDFGSAVSVIGPYQAGAAWAVRSWAKANEEVLVRYIQAHLEGLRWVLDPNNKAEASEILASRLRVSSEVAAKSYDMGIDPVNGFARDGKVNLEGFRNVLKLRAEMLKTWDVPPPTDKYLDLSYYDRAVAG